MSRTVLIAYLSTPENFLQQFAVLYVDGAWDRDTGHALRVGRHKTVADALTHALENSVDSGRWPQLKSTAELRWTLLNSYGS